MSRLRFHAAFVLLSYLFPTDFLMDPFETIARLRVVPVIAIDSAAAAVPLADALLEGGLPIAEITFRTPAAADAIRAISEKRPELLVGAGTILNHDCVKKAIDAGAKFGVAPGFNLDVIDFVDEYNWPFIPGVYTPSEIEAALGMNYKVLKFFPAGAFGGTGALRAIVSPYGHTGVRFVPTGGVTADNLASFLAIPNVIACGGTWIASRQDIAEGNWPLIIDRCRQVVEIVDKATAPS